MKVGVYFPQCVNVVTTRTDREVGQSVAGHGRVEAKGAGGAYGDFRERKHSHGSIHVRPALGNDSHSGSHALDVGHQLAQYYLAVVRHHFSHQATPELSEYIYKFCVFRYVVQYCLEGQTAHSTK